MKKILLGLIALFLFIKFFKLLIALGILILIISLLWEYVKWPDLYKGIASIFIVILFIVLVPQTSPSHNVANKPSEEATTEEVNNISKEEDKAVSEADNTSEETVTTSRENEAVNKIDTINVSYSNSVNNDKTGNWRLSRISDNIDFEEYALGYYKKYFNSDKELHVIINFTRNTTNVLRVSGSDLSLNIYDYVDGEEHDAQIMPSGQLLATYFINKDTGEIK